MISRHSTIPVPGRLQTPRKISFTNFHFWHKSFVLDDAKLAEFPRAVLNERIWHFQGVETYLFLGVKTHQLPRSKPLMMTSSWVIAPTLVKGRQRAPRMCGRVGTDMWKEGRSELVEMNGHWTASEIASPTRLTTECGQTAHNYTPGLEDYQ